MISWRLIIRSAPFALLPLVNANQVPVKTGLDRRHNYCRQSCALGIMGKLIEYVLARRWNYNNYFISNADDKRNKGDWAI